MKRITVQMAYNMLEEFGTPPHVIRHCEAVACVAERVCLRLIDKGFDLDRELVKTAGLLHDMARTEPDHQKVAADWLRERGYDAHADIIEVHMRYPRFNPVEKTNETDLVCLGDRVCIEGHYAGVDQRFDYIIKKAKRHAPDHVPIIESKRAEMKSYIKSIEDFLGISLDELMADTDTDPDDNTDKNK